MAGTMRVTFWGVRGSYPVPGPDTVQFGGNTPCVEVEVNGHTIILDAGTGIVRLGNDLLRRAKERGGPVRATLLFSHMHHDHTQGFPFFTPAYVGTSILNIFGPRVFERDLEETLAHSMLPPSFPISLGEMNSLKFMRNMTETDILLFDPNQDTVTVKNFYHDQIDDDPDVVQIRAMRSYAHPEGVFIYRVQWQGKSVVYATDTEGYVNTDQRLAAFANQTDLLIHDAQYSEAHYLGHSGYNATQGWGHSTPQMACAVAKAAQAKQLVLFHHEPRYSDAMIHELEQAAQAIFANTTAAYEGLSIEI
ncbi:MBL fold metallo-hydrolase [Herpetosiphon giganteus]|uniref:MBL fold metallo-hydrolase n=1 Tax=Herpetosiphon giganteus TaxID=2029754 RepID=UPI00195B946A|nr:MBL fold metallo-hydrolase [Herpetosiphon giganteus]MBM7845845.1 phosphoribosyl 1,2-cyclic phosphodiesterase [Herpetosiphon giganteus]